MKYFVMVQKGGNIFPIGPYKTEEGARNCQMRTSGESVVFASPQEDPKDVIAEFNSTDCDEYEMELRKKCGE